MTSTLSVEELLRDLQAIATEHAIEAYLVGGFVRDRLLDQPSKDIDLVYVRGDGMQLLHGLAQRRGWSYPQVFERFGTGQSRGEGFIVEVVRARAERYDPTSRKPDVRAGTLEEDIWRRDFTVNALCQTLGGEVLDITGRGLDDLHAGILRTPLDPAETFSEDPLRIFRAARFVAQLGFSLADGVSAAMRQEAGRASILSVERISEELRRLLTSAHPREGMTVLREGGVLEVVLPELLTMVGVEQGGYHIYDVWDHTLHALEAAPPDLITRVSVLLHDVGKPATHAIDETGKHTFYNHPIVGADIARTLLTRLRFSHEEIDAVSRIVALHLRPIQYDNDAFGDSAVRRLIRDAGEFRGQLLDVARADTVASSYPNTDNIEALAERMERLDAGGQVSRMVAPLDGEELMALANRPAGRWVGGVKRALEEAVLDGIFAADDTEAARAWLKQRPDLWRKPD